MDMYTLVTVAHADALHLGPVTDPEPTPWKSMPHRALPKVAAMSWELNHVSSGLQMRPQRAGVIEAIHTRPHGA